MSVRDAAQPDARPTAAAGPAPARPPGAASVLLVATLEWRRARARRRLFLLNTMIPLLLVAPIALGAAPPQHAAAVYAVLFALFATFGAAIPLLRDAERGWIARLTHTALDARGHLVGHALAGAAIDAVQLTPAVLIIAWTGGAWAALPALWLVVAGALAFGNLLGTWVAALARSVAEGALFAAVSCLLLLHASGVFRTPAPGSVGAWIEVAAPFRPLHEILLRTTTALPGVAPTSALVASAVIVSTALALTALPSSWLRATLAGTATQR